MRPEVCREVAELIPGARFEVMAEEAHQPFQEVPNEWNARVDALLAGGGGQGVRRAPSGLTRALLDSQGLSYPGEETR